MGFDWDKDTASPDTAPPAAKAPVQGGGFNWDKDTAPKAPIAAAPAAVKQPSAWGALWQDTGKTDKEHRSYTGLPGIVGDAVHGFNNFGHAMQGATQGIYQGAVDDVSEGHVPLIHSGIVKPVQQLVHDVPQVLPAVHDINQSPDPVGHYTQAAEDTANQAGAAALTGVAAAKIPDASLPAVRAAGRVIKSAPVAYGVTPGAMALLSKSLGIPGGYWGGGVVSAALEKGLGIPAAIQRGGQWLSEVGIKGVPDATNPTEYAGEGAAGRMTQDEFNDSLDATVENKPHAGEPTTGRKMPAVGKKAPAAKVEDLDGTAETKQYAAEPPTGRRMPAVKTPAVETKAPVEDLDGTTESKQYAGEPAAGRKMPAVGKTEPPSTSTAEGATSDSNLFDKVKAEHPDWTLSQQLMEAQKQAGRTATPVKAAPADMPPVGDAKPPVVKGVKFQEPVGATEEPKSASDLMTRSYFSSEDPAKDLGQTVRSETDRRMGPMKRSGNAAPERRVSEERRMTFEPEKNASAAVEPSQEKLPFDKKSIRVEADPSTLKSQADAEQSIKDTQAADKVVKGAAKKLANSKAGELSADADHRFNRSKWDEPSSTTSQAAEPKIEGWKDNRLREAAKKIGVPDDEIKDAMGPGGRDSHRHRIGRSSLVRKIANSMSDTQLTDTMNEE